MANPVTVGAIPTEAPVKKSVWSKRRSSWGKIYYFNTETRQLIWEDDLKTSAENSVWSKCRSYEGETYYFNTETRQVIWEDDLKTSAEEEQKLEAEQAKEDLKKFLLTTDKINSTIEYRRAEVILAECEVWKNVPDRDRREIYEVIVHQLEKKEKADADQLRKRNMMVFNSILNNMLSLTYSSTWWEAQQMLLNNPQFSEDADLQNMDKEDALVCFWGHIKMLEQEYENEKERDKRAQRRRQRKNREAFLKLETNFKNMLKQLEAQITENSTWEEIRPIIDEDASFKAVMWEYDRVCMFKEYVATLKQELASSKHSKKSSKKQKHRNQDLPTGMILIFLLSTRRKKKRSSSTVSSDDENHKPKKSKRKKTSDSYDSDLSPEHKKKKKRSSSTVSSDDENHKPKKSKRMKTSDSKEWKSSGESEESEGELESRRRQLLKALEEGK